MSEDLEALVEITLDRVIRSFDPGNSESYRKSEVALQELERRLGDLQVDSSYLLPRILAQRISLAFAAGETDLVLKVGARFLQVYEPSLPSYSVVAPLYARALHMVGEHEQESSFVHNLVRLPEVRGSDFLYLLENLVRRHPGSLLDQIALLPKLKDEIENLREEGYPGLPETSGQLIEMEQLVLAAASELRRANKERAEALLSGEG